MSNRYSLIKGEHFFHIKDNLTDKIYINCRAQDEKDAIFLVEQMNAKEPDNQVVVDLDRLEYLERLEREFIRLYEEMKELIS